MKGYETICILHPDLSEEEVQGATDRYTEILRENGGELTKSDYWGLRRLAYKIQAQTRGHLLYLLYTGPAEMVAEFERNLRITDTNIRYMTIRVDNVEEMAKVRASLLEDPTLTLQDG